MDTIPTELGQPPIERLPSATPAPTFAFHVACVRSAIDLPAAAPTFSGRAPLAGSLTSAPALQVGETAAATRPPDWVEAEGPRVDGDPYPTRTEAYAPTYLSAAGPDSSWFRTGVRAVGGMSGSGINPFTSGRESDGYPILTVESRRSCPASTCESVVLRVHVVNEWPRVPLSLHFLALHLRPGGYCRTVEISTVRASCGCKARGAPGDTRSARSATSTAGVAATTCTPVVVDPRSSTVGSDPLEN